MNKEKEKEGEANEESSDTLSDGIVENIWAPDLSSLRDFERFHELGARREGTDYSQEVEIIEKKEKEMGEKTAELTTVCSLFLLIRIL